MSAFFAISSYCNAGFDLLGMNGAFGSLISVNDQPLVLLTLSALIICGGLGFVVWQDLWNYRKRRQLFLHTKIVLASTGILLAGGTLLFLLLEWNNPKTIGSMPFWQKLLNAFFQSVTTRTAGFDSLNNPGMTGASKTVEERDERCARGAKTIREIVQAMDMPTYVRKLRELDEQHQNVILPRYADILPRNTYPAPGWKR